MRLIKFTKEGLEALKKEYEELKASRPDAVRELSRARELGDLSENGLYHAAKSRLRSIDSRIQRLSRQILIANVVKSKKYLVEQNGQTIEYEIVGDFEADPAQRRLSSNSPIGKALLGKAAGDIVEISTPKGPLTLKIIKVL